MFINKLLKILNKIKQTLIKRQKYLNIFRCFVLQGQGLIINFLIFGKTINKNLVFA